MKKKVAFNEDINQIHLIPGDEDRRSPWLIAAADRDRFRLRIKRQAIDIEVILDPLHRLRIYEERMKE